MRGFTLLFGLALAGCELEETKLDSGAGGEDTGEPAAPVDADGDGANEDLDCDDSDPEVYPGATEVCDGKDNDCEGDIDEGYDADGDGETTCAGDCDDSDAAINTSAEEVCDGQDNDCNDEVDDNVGETYYADDDNDGYGDPDGALEACVRPSGYVDNTEDCDDSDFNTRPGAAPFDSKTDCMTDADGDGYGDDAPRSTGAVAGTDCNDGTDTISPGADEVCDKVDNDCDSDVDESVVYTEDFDKTLSSSVWTLNGDATQVWSGSDGELQLTPASTSKVGSAFLNTRYAADTWSATFTVELSGGGGADGMVFLFLNESDPTTIGTNGGSLGCYELDGYGLEFDTYSNGSAKYDSDGNHIAVMSTADFSPYGSSSRISELSNTGDHDVEVYFDYGDVEVYFDGTLEIDTTVTDWASGDTLMFGFSGATGGVSNAHTVDDLSFELPCSGK